MNYRVLNRQDLAGELFLALTATQGFGVTFPSGLCWCCKCHLQQHHVLGSKYQPPDNTKFKFAIHSEPRYSHFLLKFGLILERSFLAALSLRARIRCWCHPLQDPAPSPSHQHIPEMGIVHMCCRMALESHGHTERATPVRGKSKPRKHHLSLWTVR